MKRQSGFAALEALLILVIIAVIGGTGWYAWHSKSQADKTLSTAQSEANSAPATKDSSNSKLVFKEIGVEISVPASLKGLAYTTSSTDGTTYLDVYTPAFEAALHKCDPSTASFDNSPFMSISKVDGQFNQNDNPGTGNLKQFSGFWIGGSSPNGIVCTNSTLQESFSAVFDSSTSALRGAFQTATLSQ